MSAALRGVIAADTAASTRRSEIGSYTSKEAGFFCNSLDEGDKLIHKWGLLSSANDPSKPHNRIVSHDGDALLRPGDGANGADLAGG